LKDSITQTQLTEQTNDQISKLYFSKLKIGKISKKLIELLIVKNESRKGIYAYMYASCKINKDYTRHFLWNLKNNGLISENQNELELTGIGKSIFLMCKYKINFIQLCFFLETFCCQNRMIKDGCRIGFYGILNFIEKVDPVFTSSYVAWNVSHLSKKGLIYRHHKRAFSIKPTIFNELMSYEETILFFHNWFIETWRKKREIILRDPLIIQRKHNYNHLFQKVCL
jgi:hypothetical protein